jgi:hypothetical protein
MGKECSVCYAVNPETAVECEDCGKKFETAAIYDGKPKITLIIQSEQIELPENGALIGRECGIAPEIFNHTWVSASHCRIYIDGGECYIEDIGSNGNGSTNGTFINGIKLPKRTPTKFYDGNTITIAHLAFDVRIEYPQQSQINEGPIKEIAERLIWVIECPVSGKRFEVEDSGSKITECDCPSCKNDIVDKKRISRVKPKQVRAV